MVRSHAVRVREHGVTDHNKLFPLLPLGEVARSADEGIRSDG